ncbi:hypothetical protein Lesp02_77770 [Lentzea sp. NBRC 105346]|nr:hypothetical protein Lesp02_77770 [Lentzea sp. NBRC 105346]
MTDATGKPVEGALVQVNSHEMHPLPDIAVHSLPDGHYSWPSLEPGKYQFTALKDGKTGPAVEVTIDGPTTADLRLP